MHLMATYSIVARDAATGNLGVAAQSHYFGVGAVVTWAEPGVGAVATQALADLGYGPRGLERLRGGAAAGEALRVLVAEDEGRELRQVALVDAAGGVAVHTGKACVAVAGHRTGDGYSVQGNMLRSEGTWDAMAAAYEAAEGELADRMIAALHAAEGAGGDVRGRQSAALRVVSSQRSDRPWEEKRADLRVDDHRDPVGELARLLAIERANQRMDRALVSCRSGEFDVALEHQAAARELRPEDPQIRFWAGVVLMYAGRDTEARDSFRVAFAADPGWRELLRRLGPAGLLPNASAWVEEVLGSER